MFSVGSRREEKMAKNGVKYQTKPNAVKPTNGPDLFVRGGFHPREQYRQLYQHHRHDGAGAAYEASIKKGMHQQYYQQQHQHQQQQHQQLFWRGPMVPQRTLSSYGSSGRSNISGSSSSSGRNSSSGTVRGAESMTPSQQGTDTPPMWTLLPKDLVEKVFAFLPLHSLFQARCVCKCWKNVGISNNLVKLRSEAPVAPPYYPVFISKAEDRRWCAYDHTQQKWLHFPPLTFLPKEAKHVLAGDGGLLCTSESPSSALNFVCNPITRTVEKVPSLSQDYEPGITHMVENGRNHGFQMIVTLTNYLESTHVFESRQNSWQATSCLPPHFLLWGRRSSAFCQGFLYCVALEIGGMNMEGLIAYDVKSGVWTDVHELPRGMRDEPYVLSCGGRVLVVAAQKNANGRLTSIRIVEFEPVSKQFHEVTEMPQNVMLDVFKCRGGWKPVAFGDKICVASKKTLSVAVYDMLRRSWHELPKCPLNSKVDVATFCYGPSLQSLQ